jgi:hypothetical protein
MSEYRIEYDRGTKDSRQRLAVLQERMAAGVSTQAARCAPADQKHAGRDGGRNKLITTLYELPSGNWRRSTVNPSFAMTAIALTADCPTIRVRKQRR